jgi:hypothetical protein
MTATFAKRVFDMLFGFEMIEGKWVERVPRIFRSFCKKEQREMFINQYNLCVDKSECVSVQKELYTINLFDIFKNKIMSDMSVKNPLRCNKLAMFDPYSATLAALFEKGEFEKLGALIRGTAVMPRASWAKLIFRIFSPQSAGIVFDAKTLFSEFVLEKIARKNPDKSVCWQDGLITISKDGERLLSVMLCFKNFDKEKLDLISGEIEEAWRKVSKDNIKALYIVFPRNDAFRRHIEVKNPCFADSSVKLVPYSIKNSGEKKCR